MAKEAHYMDRNTIKVVCGLLTPVFCSDGGAVNAMPDCASAAASDDDGFGGEPGMSCKVK